MAEAEDTDVSEVIKVREFINEWSTFLSPAEMYSDHQVDFRNYVQSQMKMSPKMAEEMEAVCGASTLTCEGEPELQQMNLMLNSVPTNLLLLSPQIQGDELKKRNNYPEYRRKASNHMKYKHRQGPWLHQQHHVKRQPGTSIPHPEALISVKIYKPFKKNKVLTVDQEYQVLSKQPLTDLRDKIRCRNDYIITGEYSENPDLPQNILAKDMFKSGFFYIEGVFYNDLRESTSHDYSEPIIRWSEETDRGIGPFGRESMEKTHFADLELRLGQPYVYVHQGDCQHIVVFSDIRMLHLEDCQSPEAYPLFTMQFPQRKVNCRVCTMHIAKWVTRSSPLVPEDPCFFCDACFRALHYDKDGHKIGEFKAYPYPALPSSDHSVYTS